MDAIIFVVLIGWALSAIAGASRKRKSAQEAQTRQAAETAEEGTHQPRGMRPADVDLPGQASLPIHWDGAVEGRPEPAVQPPARHEGAMQPAPMQTMTSQLTEMTSSMREEPKQSRTRTAAVIPGLEIQLDGDTLVKGVIFSEILGRRQNRRT